ncbi:hypothetical protein Taro_042005 [Colocasia esculenta]|uniref:Uncharacterized protein n=1 Tax=Colocasia esculenta TaxID=4460 RepID=A0A843X1N8_COLES|nr:hypothetical protein [Colocasia esculenta]
MEFPFGHRHHHGREEEEEEENERRRREEQHYPAPGHQHGHGHPYGEDYQRQPPPPPRYGGGSEGGYCGESPYEQPRPPVSHHEGYETGGGYSGVQHVAHEVRPEQHRGEEQGGGGYGGGHHGGPFSFAHHGSHGGSSGISAKRTVRIYTKATENYSLSVRDGKHWIKDEKFSTKVKDEEGLPSFALVNKVTGEAIKHSVGATHPVQLVPYNPDFLDESILWTESHDTGEGFRCIRMVNNIRLNFDAFHGDKDHGGVHDGTTVVLWEWMKGENQRWKVVPYCKLSPLSLL